MLRRWKLLRQDFLWVHLTYENIAMLAQQINYINYLEQIIPKLHRLNKLQCILLFYSFTSRTDYPVGSCNYAL